MERALNSAPRRRSRLARFSRWQKLTLAVSLIPALVISGAVVGRVAGLVSTEQMVEVALGAGETPGTLIFAAMFLASPVQWLTGQSQVSVRKALGVIFYGLAVNNFLMFLVDRSTEAQNGFAAEIVGSPMLLAGFIALALATPLFLTSTRWSQRLLGMRKWRLLHRLTYVVAAALVVHVLLVPDVGPDTVLILMGFAARIPTVRERLQARGQRRKRPTASAGTPTRARSLVCSSA